jgi:4-aminobutyrate aminotransferase-like enzyme
MSETFESIVTPVPGPRSRALAARLARAEVPGVTYLADDFPIFWDSASGATVVDADGNRYLDLTSAFGVAAAGHNPAAVSAAIADQSRRLIHGMGDVHPTELRVQLLEALARLAPGNLEQSYVSTSGADAVEFALKTAHLATGKPGVIAYDGAYHGLSLGALEVAGIEKFRAPFAPLVAQRATLLPFPGAQTSCDAALESLAGALRRERDVGAVILEPIQGRAGVIVPPAGFLRGVRALCDEFGVLMILDEIYTGFGRTGAMFACRHEDVVPDLLCVGKALGGGVPLAATIGSARVMGAWPPSRGEALHTATFMGNPLACAAALANLELIESHNLAARAARDGPQLGAALASLRRFGTVRDVRGIGFLWAVELTSAEAAYAVVAGALQRGLILLQSGPTGASITLAPPLAIGERQLERALTLFERTLQETEADR